MALRSTPKLSFPLEKFETVSSSFGNLNSYDGQDWGMHLGVDFPTQAGTQVLAIGKGTVVYSTIHPGRRSKKGKIIKRNWGGIIIIAHYNNGNQMHFFSVYGHMGKCLVKKGDAVELGDIIGTIGTSMTKENGFWEEEHLHFGIYIGPFSGKVLPGYYKKEAELTKMEYWQEPLEFIKDY